MWVGGPPKPMHPILVHSRQMVESATGEGPGRAPSPPSSFTTRSFVAQTGPSANAGPWPVSGRTSRFLQWGVSAEVS